MIIQLTPFGKDSSTAIWFNSLLCQLESKFHLFWALNNRPIEDRAVRMSRTIDSRHSRRIASRNGPMSWMRSGLPEKQEEPRLRSAIRSRRRQQSLSLVGGNGKRKGTDTTARRTSRLVTPTKVPAAGRAIGPAPPFFRTAQDEWLGR